MRIESLSLQARETVTHHFFCNEHPALQVSETRARQIDGAAFFIPYLIFNLLRIVLIEMKPVILWPVPSFERQEDNSTA